MIRRDALSEYLRGSLWALPTLSVLAALVVGSTLSLVDIGPTSPLAFQGTADDARNLLIGITGTMVTVIALLLGLTVVALQLSSTQFSPRLLRNFLRDRPNQIVLSTFVATFAYSATGLYTVGVSAGTRTTEFPRLAVTGALVLLFASLCMLVFFADHLAHSIQIDAIMSVVERHTLAAIRHGALLDGEKASPAPDWAVPIPARRSGYVQVVNARMLLSHAERHRVSARLRPRVGEHVVTGTTLAWTWRPSSTEPAPDAHLFYPAINEAVRVGFERTFEQDAGFGIRQLVDIATKALSPAVNDPYTAIQAIQHLSVIFCTLAPRRLGDHVLRGRSGATITILGWRFSQYLAVACGVIRRYGAREPTVAQAMLRLLGDSAAVLRDDPERFLAIEEQARMVVTEVERNATEPADLAVVRAEAESVRRVLAARRSSLDAAVRREVPLSVPPQS
jgi:uncharacterized membrane protein